MEMLEKCNGVAVRDTLSLATIKDSGANTNVQYIPDALFSCYHYYKNNKQSELFPKDLNLLIPHPESEEHLNRWDFSRPYICVSDGSLPKKAKNARNENAYIALIEKIKEIGLPVYIVNTGGGNFLYSISQKTNTHYIPVNINIFAGGAILANAEVFISGRFHPSILASLGGTPCVFLSSNSHKTWSIQKILNYDVYREFSMNPSADEADLIVEKAKEYIEQGNSCRQKIQDRASKLSEEAEQITEFIRTNL